MGTTTSRPTMNTPKDIFSLKGAVQSHYLKTALGDRDGTRTQALFLSKALRECGSGIQYWTEETFVSHLMERSPQIQHATKKAGPVLYKMMLHYGSFPFPAEQGSQLILETFCLGIVMMSRIGLRPLLRLHDGREGGMLIKKRQPVDRVRLCFQSLQDQSEIAVYQAGGKRSVDDDKDLVDAIMAIGKSRRAKMIWGRDTIIDVASGLPCSYSRNLQGAVSTSDVRVLIELAVALSRTFTGAGWVPSHAGAVESLMRAFSIHTNSSTEITWENFSSTLIGSMPNLLPLLSGYIERTFEITDLVWVDAALAEHMHINKFLADSRTVSPGYLAQLLLIIPGGLPLCFKDILFQGVPREIHINTIATQLRDPGRALFIQGQSHSQSQDAEESHCICVYTGTPKHFKAYLDSPGIWSDACIVFSISPIHRVYYPTKQRDGFLASGRSREEESSHSPCVGYLDIKNTPDGFNLGIQQLKMQFSDGMRVFTMVDGDVRLAIEVDELELWSLPI
ncbi:hypothetical protein P280DRAFT_96169 [Massarina eburnea CBS 473.64]|uniref:TLDc domain-containing protein n=1 Tax=Massarina eburnea CBS 473.64 TaxID=1395130 RepID=A0A6A6RTR3_9PLEO|nr:hypothetical protein P280DRAFT_96169 [Massarina eburnea CBS 473.64]